MEGKNQFKSSRIKIMGNKLILKAQIYFIKQYFT